MAPPAGIGLANLPDGTQRPGLEDGLGVHEFRRKVRRAKNVQRRLRLPRVKKQLGIGRRRHAIVRIVLDQRRAQIAGTLKLAVPHKQPHGRKEKLPMVFFH